MCDFKKTGPKAHDKSRALSGYIRIQATRILISDFRFVNAQISKQLTGDNLQSNSKRHRLSINAVVPGVLRNRSNCQKAHH